MPPQLDTGLESRCKVRRQLHQKTAENCSLPPVLSRFFGELFVTGQIPSLLQLFTFFIGDFLSRTLHPAFQQL